MKTELVIVAGFFALGLAKPEPQLVPAGREAGAVIVIEPVKTPGGLQLSVTSYLTPTGEPITGVVPRLTLTYSDAAINAKDVDPNG